MVYNSSIGLEASIMGSPVLCAGRARYTQMPIAYFPTNRDQYRDQLGEFLSQPSIEMSEEFIRNARRFLFFELYHASLDFSHFMEPYPDAPGNAVFAPFDPLDLTTTHEMIILRDGILEGKPFLY
jgi:hypothetical protein